MFTINILITQPILEKNIEQLEVDLKNNPHVDIVIFPEGYLNENVAQACSLAKEYNTVLIGGHRRLQDNPKDRAIIINRDGEVVLDRVKYSQTGFALVEGLKIGHILCDELIIQGIKGEEYNDVDLIVHPIGVGMFSNEQFDEWINKATKIAEKFNTMVIGTSHADGTFRNMEVSIPIAYCINRDGSVVFISGNDIRTRILSLETLEVIFPES